MSTLRRSIAAHSGWFALLFAAALALRVLIPTGYMPQVSETTIIVGVCNGTGPATMTIALPMEDGPAPADHQQPSDTMPCAFAGLGDAASAGADPLLLAAALSFLLALGVSRTRNALPPAAIRLRPPSRGPPLTPSIR